MAHLSGFNPFKPSLKFDIHRVGYCTIQLLAIIMTAYSINMEWSSLSKVVEVSMGIGIFTQTISKAILISINAGSLKKLQLDVQKMYKAMETVDEKREKVLAKSIKYCELIFKALFLIDSSAVVIFLAYPVIALIFLDNWPLMFPFYCPFVDHQTVAGFIINSIIHAILIVYTLLLHTPFDSIFALYVMQVVAKVELLKLDFEEFKELVLNSELENSKVQKEIKKSLRNIILSQKELNLYIQNIGEYFIMPCFVTVTSSVFSICIALVLMLVINWVLAYGLTWALSGQLFIYFLYGSIIHHYLNVLGDQIYDFPWYLLNVPEQKMFRLMIMMTQRPLNLELTFIGPLNMETFNKVR